MDKFSICSKYYAGEQLELITKKGIYPYDYVDSFDKFNETVLPDIRAFDSKLKEQNLSTDDYAHAQNVWKTFNIKNLGEYHDLYMKTDVLILADVFENFRNTSLNTYKLDPCHYYGVPSLSWDAALYITEVNLELITDPEMYKFFEKDIRGGISVITQRYARANNRYMKDYKPTKEESYIIYLDANNLYGWAMSQHLPISDFKWINKSVINKYNRDTFAISDIPDDDETGYIFEVDIEIPHDIHDKLNDYPIAEKLLVKPDMLSIL